MAAALLCSTCVQGVCVRGKRAGGECSGAAARAGVGCAPGAGCGAVKASGPGRGEPAAGQAAGLVYKEEEQDSIRTVSL